MSGTTVRVFVNERGVSVAVGASALDAVRALSPDDADAIAAGRRRLTDSRGLPVDAGESLVNGAIYRVVAVRAAAADAADAVEAEA